MAIQLTPQRKEITDKTLWVTILFYFSLALFLVAGASYFVLDYFVANSSDELAAVETDIRQASSEEEEAQEKEVLKKQELIKNFSKLLAEHRFVSSFFTDLELWCHPRVWFSQIGLSVNDSSVSLSGQTDNFQTLGQQMIVLKNNQLVKNIDLSNISMGTESRINFNLNIVFNPQIFSYNLNIEEEDL